MEKLVLKSTCGVFHSSVARAALYILLLNASKQCIEETFTITIDPIVCSGLVSMWRKIAFFDKNEK
jgi:hypothetical protein